MSQIDYTSKAGQLQLQESLNSQLRILAGIRAKALAGCYNTLPATKSKNSKSLSIGTLDMTKVTGAIDDINKSEITVGATYLNKEEYAEEVIFPGSMLRYSERNPIPQATQRLMEADDYVMDKTLMDALIGPMYVGDSAAPIASPTMFSVPHGGLGITPQKITQAATAVRRFMPNANLQIGIEADIHEQLTAFDAFTNSDILLNGQESAYSGKVLKSKWFGVGFKMVPDFVVEDASDPNATPELKPVIPIEPYITGGTWDNQTWIRHIPVWASSGVDFEEMMAPQTEVFPIWKQRSKPKGTMAARIDHELGFARNNKYAVAIIQALVVNPFLSQ